MSITSRFGMIRAIVLATKETVENAEEYKQRDTVIMAKELAFDKILKVVESEDYCPWNEIGGQE